MQRTLLQIVVALLLGWLLSQGGLPWIASGFVFAGVLVWPWAQWLANGYVQLSFLQLTCALQAPFFAAVALLLFLFFAQEYTAPSAFTLVLQMVVGAGIFLGVHVLITKTKPRAYNALADLTHLFAPKPND
jgi:hypothetical protein